MRRSSSCSDASYQWWHQQWEVIPVLNPPEATRTLTANACRGIIENMWLENRSQSKVTSQRRDTVDVCATTNHDSLSRFSICFAFQSGWNDHIISMLPASLRASEGAC